MLTEGIAGEVLDSIHRQLQVRTGSAHGAALQRRPHACNTPMHAARVTALRTAATPPCMQGVPAAELHSMRPQLALALALAEHPAFGAAARPALPALCAIARAAAAAGDVETLAPMLAAIARTCTEAAARLVLPDAAEVARALLAAMPAPPHGAAPLARASALGRDDCTCAVLALAGLSTALHRAHACSTAWLRLHADVLSDLAHRLHAFPPEVAALPVDLAASCAAPPAPPPPPEWTSHTALLHQPRSLAELAAVLLERCLHTHRAAVARVAALRPAGSGSFQEYAGAHAPQPPPQEADAARKLLHAAHELLSGTLVPAFGAAAAGLSPGQAQHSTVLPLQTHGARPTTPSCAVKNSQANCGGLDVMWGLCGAGAAAGEACSGETGIAVLTCLAAYLESVLADSHWMLLGAHPSEEERSCDTSEEAGWLQAQAVSMAWELVGGGALTALISWCSPFPKLPCTAHRLAEKACVHHILQCIIIFCMITGCPALINGVGMANLCQHRAEGLLW
jgi:hypothetical protein